MLISYGSAKILKVATSLTGLANRWNGGILKRAAKNLESMDLDPGKYLYLRNRAVSALELHGPNQNWDAFEYDELQNKYSSFIGKPISVDHIGTNVIGTVLDSEFIQSPEVRASLGLPLMPLQASVQSLGKLCSRDRDTFNRVFDFASRAGLVKDSDEKRVVEAVCKTLANSGWVENIWAIEKTAAEEHTPGLCAAILNNDVQDSSMGAMVNASVCSVCGHTATGDLPEEEDFCEHILDWKGENMPLDGVVVVPFEINRDIEEFFEDSLILPFEFGGQAGGEGADKDAKLLEVYAARRRKRAYIETSPQNHRNMPSPRDYSDVYNIIGESPAIVEKNQNEFLEERKEEIRDYVDKQNAPGKYPEGTMLSVVYEGNDVDAVVIEEREDNTVLVAIDGLDEPVEVGVDDIVRDSVEYPEGVDYKQVEEFEDVPNRERGSEQRAS